jgi:hypothetical protein
MGTPVWNCALRQRKWWPKGLTADARQAKTTIGGSGRAHRWHRTLHPAHLLARFWTRSCATSVENRRTFTKKLLTEERHI